MDGEDLEALFDALLDALSLDCSFEDLLEQAISNPHKIKGNKVSLIFFRISERLAGHSLSFELTLVTNAKNSQAVMSWLELKFPRDFVLLVFNYFAVKFN